MATHAATKRYVGSAIIVGWVLVALVWVIFSSLAQNYVTYIPLLLAYAAWTVVAVLMFGRGLDCQMAAEPDTH